MRSLDRKLVRDLWSIKGQVVAICMVIAAGVATFVMSLSTLESLSWCKDTYYERYRFAHVFTHVKRAPNSLAKRIASIPGVARVQTRIYHFCQSFIFDTIIRAKSYSGERVAEN